MTQHWQHEGQSYLAIIPSIRTITLEYLDPLEGMPVLVVDDADGAVVCTRGGETVPWPSHITRVTREDMRRQLPSALFNIIPEKNPSCKNFGLWYGWQHGYNVLVLLDDDCDLRVSPDFLSQIPIKRPRNFYPVKTGSVWFNTLDLLTNQPHRLWARGFPYIYRDLPPSEPWFEQQMVSMFNEGLWCGTPDINGLDKYLIDVADVEVEDRRCVRNVALSMRQQLPLSIMNVQLASELVPAFYQPPDWDMPAGMKVRRHDDVWAMYVLKAVMNVKGHRVTVGNPVIWHRKSGNKEREMLGEHYTNVIQPYLQDVVDKAALMLDPADCSKAPYADLTVELARHMRRNAQLHPKLVQTVLVEYADRLMTWALAFRRAESDGRDRV